MHSHAALLEKFYQAFQKRDHATMASCYHPEVVFSDPVFPRLEGFKAGAMWHMLCERGKDLKLEFSQIQGDDQSGRAHWEAWYTFSQTGRKVHNVIDATFTFRDGLIAEHTDRFDMWRWSRQALGAPGLVLGWTPILKGAVRKKANQGLEIFIKKNNLG
jgi:ketosteroid isomerase-like protein